MKELDAAGLAVLQKKEKVQCPDDTTESVEWTLSQLPK